MDNISYLLKVSDVDKPFDIVDDCDEKPEEKPFPIAFKINYDEQIIYLISIEEHLLDSNNH